MTTKDESFSVAKVRKDFPIVERCIYLNHAAIGPISRRVRQAMITQVDLHMEHIDRAGEVSASTYQKGREMVARLVGSRPERIAYVQNTSHGLSLVAAGIDWREGDNVVVPAMEFPSNFLIWKTLQSKGVALRPWTLDHGRLTADGLRGLVDNRTRVVAVSQVQFHNGFRCDLAAYGEVCRSHDALLVVDGTQSTGALAVDVAASGVDALVVSSHKWMLGPLGIGFMALSDRAFDQLSVHVVGWLSVVDPFQFRRELDFLPTAERFEPGTENGAGIYGLTARLEEIEDVGIKVIEGRILALNEQFAEALRSSGYRITSPWGMGERSGILTFMHRSIPSETLLERLSEARTHVSLRGGAIRISPHYYNSEAELEETTRILLA